MQLKGTLNIRGTHPPKRTQKDRINKLTPGPRKVVGHNHRRTRLFPIIVSVSLLLLAASPMILFFYGNEMTMSAGGSPVATVTGTNDDDYFGWNVSSAGDVNGDGYDDVIVGAPGCDSDRGRAYLFFGGPWFSGDLLAQNANVTLNGDAPGDLFGWDVSGAGDVNDDGFDDVIVGAPGNNSDTGAAYIFFGGANMESVFSSINASAIPETQGPNDNTGELNTDDAKYDDAIIYKVKESGTGNNTLEFDTWNTTNLPPPPWDNATLNIEYTSGSQYKNNDYIQWAVEGMIYQNTGIQIGQDQADRTESWEFPTSVDTIDEITNMNITFTNTETGGIDLEVKFDYIWIAVTKPGYGTAADANVTMIGYSMGDEFGASVSSAGDVNNDGYHDVIVGAPYARKGYEEIIIDDDDVEYSDVGNWTDNSLATAYRGNYRYEDDIPNNGDFATWIPVINVDGLYEAFIWWPSPPADRATDAPFTINFKVGGRFYLPPIGGYITGIQDCNGSDGNIIINVTQNETAYGGQWNSLGLYEFESGATGNITLTDEANDRIVADAMKFMRCTSEGAAYLFLGSNNMVSPINSSDANIALFGNNSGDGFGYSVSSAGDVNNDGCYDVLVGAPGANRAFVFLNFGKENPAEIMLLDDFEDGILPDWYEEEPADGLASVGNASGAINGTLHLTVTDDTDAVSPIIDARGYNNLTLTYKRRMSDGDWSGDEDLLVMIRVDGGSWVSIPSEEAHGDTQTPDLIEYRQVDLSPYNADNSLIEIKFDLNDGGIFDTSQKWDFDDVRITVRPYFSEVILEGGNTIDQFGFSASGAGDVDCDGFDDIIVGAPQNNIGAGAAYIFEGVFINMENSADGFINLSGGDAANVTLTGEASNDLFGYSVSCATNLTGDGFSDVIIGAPGANGNGAVHVFFGGNALPSSISASGANHIELGESSMDYFGWSVSGAGDVIQADGYDEIIVGAPFHDPVIKTDAGKAYLLKAVSRPVIRYVTALPGLQISGGNVNISCDITALDGVGGAWVNISLPGGGYVNDTMIQGSGDQWFYNNTYTTIGTYLYTIWASDNNGNWTQSQLQQFEVVNRLPTLLSGQVNPDTGFVDTWYNFTVIYTDMDDHVPGFITVNITGIGIYALVEVDPLDIDYTDGKEYYFDITGFSPGQYTYHFAACDAMGDWTETLPLQFEVVTRAPVLSLGQVTPTVGFDDTQFNFTVTYTDLDGHAPDTITVNITGLGIYQLNEVDTLDMDHSDGKSYYIEITAIPLGTSYSFHFAANDTLGNWAIETPEIDAPDVLQSSATLTALDETVEYSDTAYLNATLMESGTPIAGENIEFYIDMNNNGFYEPGELVGSATTLADGRVSIMYSTYLVPGAYNFTAVYIGSGGFDVNDSYAQITIAPKPASLTAVSRIAEEDEVISLSATLLDSDGNPIAGEGVEIYLDKNRNVIYEASEMMGYQTTSVGGVASITYTVTLSPGDYDIWARYRGSGNYSVTEIEGVLVVQNTSNTPPTILGIVPDQIRPEDSLPWTLDLTTYEADLENTGPDLKWFLTGVDASLYSVTGYNSSDDVFTIIPKENAFGNNEVTLWLVDGSGDWDSQVMWVNLTPVNDVPYFYPKPPDIFVHYNDPGTADDDPTPWDYTFYVHDIETPKEGLAILTSEPTEDSGDGYAEVTGLNITFHYPQSRVGDSIFVTLTLYDGFDSTQTVIMVNVTSDWIPELVSTLPDVTIEENSTNYNVFDLDDYFTDRDHDSLFFSSGYQHLTVVINSNNTVDITAAGEWTGSELVTFRAMDPTGAIVEDTITVTVIPVNDGPVISGAPDLIVHYDYSYGFDFTPYIEDTDNPHSELSLWTSELTDNIWIQEYNNLGIVVNYPESMDGMTFPVTIFVSDGVSTASQEIQITISDNFPPELMYSLPDVSFDEDTLFEDAILLSYYYLDIDGDALFFSNGSTFINVVINNDLTVDFSAPENWYGFETVTFRATDPTGSIAEDTILIVVVPVNDAPIIDSIPGQEKNEGDQWVLDLSQYIDDVDNDASELIITVESEAGQGYVTLTGDILVFQYPEGINTDIVTITVNDGELETQRSFTVTLQSQAPVAPSIWNLIPWHWVLLMFFVALGGAFALYNKRSKYIVHEAFLIHEKGLPIAHASRQEGSELEDVVVSGMFTAVQDFISDAFSGKTQDDDWKLDEMKFGENKILIERSQDLYLAAIFEGNGDRLGNRLRNLLKDIDEKYSDVFTDWDGDMTELAGISAVITALVSKKVQKNTGSGKPQTEIPSELDSEEPVESQVEEEDIGRLYNEEQETIEKDEQETPSEETVVFECPECYSEIRSIDIRCPVCGVEFAEVNDIENELIEDNNEIKNVEDEEEDRGEVQEQGGDEP